MMENRKSVVHLFIPRLLQPLKSWRKDFLFHSESPNLSQLLRSHEIKRTHHKQGLDASLFAHLGLIDKELPSAYYRFQASLSDRKMYKNRGGVYNISDYKGTLLCADPIHLEVGMNDITMTDRITDLDDNEASQLITELNKHFKQDGLEFLLGTTNKQWYLSLPTQESVNTTPVDEVLRKNIAHFLPTSKSRNWQILLTELQMLLHASSVNQQREIRGLPTVNSLWLWGGGAPFETSHSQSNIKNVYSSSEDKGKAFASATGCEWHFLNISKKGIPDFAQGETVIILNQLSLPSIYDNLEDYQQALKNIDQNIILPLMNKWETGEINLHIESCDGRVITPVKIPKWKFWENKPKPLLKIAL